MMAQLMWICFSLHYCWYACSNTILLQDLRRNARHTREEMIMMSLCFINYYSSTIKLLLYRFKRMMVKTKKIDALRWRDKTSTYINGTVIFYFEQLFLPRGEWLESSRSRRMPKRSSSVDTCMPYNKWKLRQELNFKWFRGDLLC